MTYPIGLFAARISRMIGTGAADDRFAEPRRDRGDAVRRRSQGGEKACRGGAPFPGTRPAGCRAGPPAGGGGEGRAPSAGWDRCLHAGVFALLGRGRGAHVPRRGAAAHPRQRDPGQAHRRQDRRQAVGTPYRPVGIALRQRLRLGPDAHRPLRRARQGCDHRYRRLSPPSRLTFRRALHPQCHETGHADHGPAVRAWPDDRRSARYREAARGRRLSLLL